VRSRALPQPASAFIAREADAGQLGQHDMAVVDLHAIGEAAERLEPFGVGSDAPAADLDILPGDRRRTRPQVGHQRGHFVGPDHAAQR
jgi:hypothetical protein